MIRPLMTLEAYRARIGHVVQSDWILIDQPMIDGFASVTRDDAFIHVDPDRARQTRFAGTIAHGLLTLSLLPYLMRSAIPLIEGGRMGVNYGFDRVRFLSPVPVNSHVRLHMTLMEIREAKPDFFRFAYDLTVEIQGSDKPAASASWLLGQWIGAPKATHALASAAETN